MDATTCEIKNYTTGKVIGEAKVDAEVYSDYESQRIGQWPEGIIPACELLSVPELMRLGIDADETVWIEI